MKDKRTIEEFEIDIFKVIHKYILKTEVFNVRKIEIIIEKEQLPIIKFEGQFAD